MPREGKAKVLTENEFKRLLKIVAVGSHAKRNTALLYVSYGLGLRAKEMSLLKVSHILNQKNNSPFEEINLTGNMTKGEKQRHIYLTNPKVQKALLEYLEERKLEDASLFNYQAPLFLSQKGDKFSPNALQQLFSQMYKQAGIVGASSHSGRRTFATRLIERGIDIKAVSRLMGHANISMTAQYVEDNPVRLKRIAEELQF